MERYFNPFVGKRYQQGIGGKRVLVLGASFYCNMTDCREFFHCTGDASYLDKKGWATKSYDCPNSDFPAYAISDGSTTYERLAAYLGPFVGSSDYDTIWSHFAFTNYIQHILAGEKGKYRETRPSDIADSDFEAFNDVLLELQPHIVIVLGSVINSHVKEWNPYLVSMETLKQTDYYLCQLSMPGIDHVIDVINPYHPSSSAWYGDLETFDRYFKSLL